MSKSLDAREPPPPPNDPGQISSTSSGQAFQFRSASLKITNDDARQVMKEDVTK
jgi:hypothetical protein